MAESVSVKAILSARDQGFSSTFKNALDAANTLGNKLKSGLGFDALKRIGQGASDAVTGSLSGLIGVLNTSSATWKTFQGSMEISGKTQKQISATKRELQSFAEQTIYTSSDMASSFAQLDAVGTKNTVNLVKGFGGLAAAAEDPKQAMATLSQQAAQMAAKPMVQWKDFEVMLNQTPTGIAAVAKQMGMSTQDMIKNVQNGKIKTEDFFDAISKVGTNDAFTKLASEYKDVDQAVGGLTETVGNKLQPAFDIVSGAAIKGIGGISDAFGKIDGEALAAKVSAGMEKAQPYWETFKSVALSVGGVLKTVGGFLLDHAGVISKLIPVLLGLVGAYKGFTVVKSIIPGVQKFSGSISQLVGKGLGKLAPQLTNTAKAQTTVGNASKVSSGSVLSAAAAMVAFGAAVLLAGAGFYLIATSAVKVAEAGPLAIGVLIGMVAAIAALALGASILGPALTAGAIGFIAFGAAILMVGVGALLAATALSIVASVLPVITQYGASGAIAITQLGLSMIPFAAGAAAAGVGTAILAVGLTVLAVGLALAGAAALITSVGVLALAAGVMILRAGLALVAASVAAVGAALPLVASGALTSAVAFASLLASSLMLAVSLLPLGAALTLVGATSLLASAGILAFGAGMLIGAAGTLAMGVALKLVSSSMKSIAKNAKTTQVSLMGMQASVKVVSSGVDALGNKVKSAMNKLTSSFNDAAGKAKTAGQKVGTGFTQGMQSGLNKAPSIASKAITQVNAKFRSGRSGAQSAGAYISQGFAAGMRSQLGIIQSAAAKMASAADKAVRAKAKIASPSKVFMGLGQFVGEGFANGITDMQKNVGTAANKLVSIPAVATPDITGSYGGELSADYNYSRSGQYTIVVPVELDGKETAKIIAPYAEAELNKRQTRENRKKGIR